MLILIFCGLMGLIAIPFLLFCHRSFARAKNVLRNRKQGGNVFPLGYHRGRRQPSLLVLGLLIQTMAMVAQNSSHPPYVANNPASSTSTVNSGSPPAAAVSALSGTPVIGAPERQSYPLMQTINQN